MQQQKNSFVFLSTCKVFLYLPVKDIHSQILNQSCISWSCILLYKEERGYTRQAENAVNEKAMPGRYLQFKQKKKSPLLASSDPTGAHISLFPTQLPLRPWNSLPASHSLVHAWLQVLPKAKLISRQKDDVVGEPRCVCHHVCARIGRRREGLRRVDRGAFPALRLRSGATIVIQVVQFVVVSSAVAVGGRIATAFCNRRLRGQGVCNRGDWAS